MPVCKLNCNESGRKDLATKADLATAINKMLLGQLAVAGLLFAALKLF